MTALVLAVSMLFASTVNIYAEEEIEFPEAEVTDVYQIDEENGDDTAKSWDGMYLMDDYTYDATFEASISSFPETYKDALRRIHTLYPNFTFVADKINMTLDEAVRTQLDNGYKTYRSTYTNSYDTIYKFMDPLTYLYPAYDGNYDVYSSAFDYDWHLNADFFVFADHAYSTNQYAAALQYLVDGCDFLENEDMNSIISASAKCSMNPYVMASTVILEKGWQAKSNGNADVTGRVVNKGHVSGEVTVYAQENGTKGTSVLGTIKDTDVYIVSGGDVSADNKTWYKIVYDSDGNLFDSSVRGVPGFVEASKVSNVAYFNTYFNLFSINQTDSNPVVGGIAYAMSHDWTSLAASFEGGANFCKTYYYDNNQTTYYYMHYNVKNAASNWWHEYSTGVSADLKCARILRYAYDYDHNQTLTLKIPVYNDPPAVQWYNGAWTYIKSNGKPDYSYNGIASNEYGVWYIRNGLVDFSVNGLALVGDAWYYFKGGALQTDYTGIQPNEYGWWRVVNGRVDFGCNSVEANEYGWWYIENGKINFDYTGIKPNAWGWWRIENGWVNFNFTGLAPNEYGWWYLENGCVRFDYTGIKPNEYGWWRIVNGNVDFSCNSVEANEYGWWYCEGGKVQFDYTGLKPNAWGWWRIEGGAVNFNYNGLASNESGTWYIQGGKVQFGYTGPYTENGITYNIVGGRVS